MVKELRNESGLDKDIPIQVAGASEKKSYTERSKGGILLKSVEYEAFKKLSEEYGIQFE